MLTSNGIRIDFQELWTGCFETYFDLRASCSWSPLVTLYHPDFLIHFERSFLQVQIHIKQ